MQAPWRIPLIRPPIQGQGYHRRQMILFSKTGQIFSAMQFWSMFSVALRSFGNLGRIVHRIIVHVLDRHGKMLVSLAFHPQQEVSNTACLLCAVGLQVVPHLLFSDHLLIHPIGQRQFRRIPFFQILRTDYLPAAIDQVIEQVCKPSVIRNIFFCNVVNVSHSYFPFIRQAESLRLSLLYVLFGFAATFSQIFTLYALPSAHVGQMLSHARIPAHIPVWKYFLSPLP